ncbi:MAG: amidohydrolase family protein [Flavobacteriaceae bacterium]|nr:amidohydrolase [Flavobacteriaceae bacterium]|tara:strand:+ start:4273 stop:5400 length:1128 start_codon:yes stop_codon:yes gene_type:complete
MRFFSIKNFFKIFLFVSILGSLCYFIIVRLHYAYNIISFEDYNPKSTLVVSSNEIKRSKYPFIDIHNHQFDMPVKDLSDLVSEMDSLNMAFMVNLSGFRGQYLKMCLDNIKKNAPERLGVFVNLNWENIDSDTFLENNIKILRDAKKDGAIGLKVYKSLGLSDKDSNGNRIAVNDPRIDPIWEECGKLGFPVLIHSADPASFWKRKDKNNERWLELKQKPNRYRNPDLFPSFESIIAEQHNVFEKHPKTTFINAHLGWMGNDLDRLSSHLDKYPNVVTEIGAVLAELGRQPKRARKFFIDHQDKILFGKDAYNLQEYYTYFRVLETEDEYFDYYRKRHAFWKMYGLGLPDSILKKVYYKNALRILPSVNKSLFKS